MARTAKKQQNGLHANAGRFVLLLLFLLVVVLASSTISDEVQHLIDDSIAEHARVHNGAADEHEHIRAALLRRTAMDADAVRHLSTDELLTLFGEPSLKRQEGETMSWHFTSGECALDIYFPQNKKRPAYAEYRVRGEIEEGGLVEKAQGLDHKACLKSLYASARTGT